MNHLFDLVHRQYTWEAERRDKLNSASSIPIGFATLSMAALSNGISKIKNPFAPIEIVALFLFAVGILCSVFFAYNTVKFFLDQCTNILQRRTKLRTSIQNKKNILSVTRMPAKPMKNLKSFSSRRTRPARL